MSHIDFSITNELVIPSLESDIFADHPMAGFAVGLLAVGDEVISGREEEFNAYLRLRANVYATQTRMISTEQVRDDGTEMDEDDDRSVHFAVIENGHDRQGDDKANRVVAAMRLIVKAGTDDRPLPIEAFFPEVFPEPLSKNAVEVSRYICRHEVESIQDYLKWPLYSAALTKIATRNLGPTYGVVEPALERALRRQFVPIERIGEPKYVAEYAADNLPIRIDTAALISRMEGLKPGMMAKAIQAEQEFVYFGTVAPQPHHSYQATA